MSIAPLYLKLPFRKFDVWRLPEVLLSVSIEILKIVIYINIIEFYKGVYSVGGQIDFHIDLLYMRVAFENTKKPGPQGFSNC